MAMRGVVFDQNPSLIDEQGDFFNDPATSDLCIRVVNLQQNGLYPNAAATLPGMNLAELTVCAIGTDVFMTDSGGGYKFESGSSFAAPYVTSVALVLKGAFPGLSKEQIRWCILEGATPIVLNDNFEPCLIENLNDLQNYSSNQIEMDKAIFGQGLLNGKGAFEKAYECMNSSKISF